MLEPAKIKTRFGDEAVTKSARGVPAYRIEVFHDGLQKHRAIRAGDRGTLRKRCHAQAEEWDGAWRRQRYQIVVGPAGAALEQTSEAQLSLATLRNILIAGLESNPTIEWDDLQYGETESPAPADAPKQPEYAREPVASQLPPAPDRSAAKYKERTIVGRMADWLAVWVTGTRVTRDSESRFNADMKAWRDTCEALSDGDRNERDGVRQRNSRLREEYNLALAKWQEEKSARERIQQEEEKFAHEMRQLRARYRSKSPDAVVEYCERVLLNSNYPDCIPREFDFDLNPETGVLLLDCKLPAPDNLPRLSEVKYGKATGALSRKLLSEAQSARLYDDVVYQITLRTIHEIFQSDSAGAISTVVFNGIVVSTDKGTGNDATACIVSVQVSKEVFQSINLAKVDPKVCFRQLKGVGSSKLHSITAIAPIMALDRDDRRFVPSYGVADRLNEGDNLATMDWQDFEHLIRELFGKEFSSGGGEVRVTRASRDYGVDAIAFDPDPIRGGKIVIQAKRYAYPVEVSAVRDLYGTVMNEGAMKGILVTTSDYGPDAYEFVKGKPLTLFSGSQLLGLLKKHGTKAHINLAEARKLAHERSIKSGPESKGAQGRLKL